MFFSIFPRRIAVVQQEKRLNTNKMKHERFFFTLKAFISFYLQGDTNERHNPNGIPNVAWGSVLPVNIERTLPSYASDTKPTDGSWQIVNGTRFKFFVFSAFYDRRGGKLIRIIGATKTRVPEKVWCRFVYNIGNATAPNYRSVSVMARVKVCICTLYSICMCMCHP